MTFGRFFAWTVAVAIILAACATPPPAPEEDFGFSLSETTLAAVPGTSVTTSATIIPDNGFTGIVALAISDQNGTPADPGITLNPGSIVVGQAILGSLSVQRQVTIDVTFAVVNARYDLRITATSGNLSSEADFTLTVADTLQPQVAITSPADGDTFTGSRGVTLTGTLAAVSDIVNVTVEGVGSVVSTVFDQSSFTIMAELADNLNSVVVTAEDDQGQLGSSSPMGLRFPFMAVKNFQAASVVIGQLGFGGKSPNQGPRGSQYHKQFHQWKSIRYR